MGRRKIQIKPIQHERNRTVTFLKRKQGLFKKAYELSVLCSIDIAVIIFDKPAGQPKCYEFSSGNVNEIVNRHVRFDGERDTKGTADFVNGGANGRKDDDEEDEEDDYRANYGMNYMRGPHAPVMPDYGMHHPPMPGHPSLPGYPRMMPDDRGAGPVVPDRQRRASGAAGYRPYPDPHRRDMGPGGYGGYPASNPYPPTSRGPMNGSPLMPANSLMSPHGPTPPLGVHNPHESYNGHPSSIISGHPMPPTATAAAATPYHPHQHDLHSPSNTAPLPMSWSGTHSIHHSPALTHNSLVHSPPSSISGSTATSDAGWSNVGGFFPDVSSSVHSPSGSPHLEPGNSPVGPALPV